MHDEPAFEWDEFKNLSNVLKHGVSFEDAQAVFLDPCRVIAQDTLHSIAEDRYYCIGRDGKGSILTVRFHL